MYAEPSVVEQAAWEFADTENMIAAAERLYGPYRWGRYDVLVLPPSFPFGGMENPRLTFAHARRCSPATGRWSPLVAHELAHSWSGNLVTNATWNDFWLNEGFTVYFERRIIEEVYGASLRRDGAAARTPGPARRSCPASTRADTRLELDLAGRDPDEGITTIAYEKGSLFLRAARAGGGPRALRRVPAAAYFDRFAFQSMDTTTFLAYLRAELLEPAGVSGRGALARRVGARARPARQRPCLLVRRAGRAGQRADELVAGRAARDLDTDGWSTQQWVHFIRALPRDLDTARLAELDKAFGLSRRGNGEILESWLQLAIDSGYVFESSEADDALASFLTRQGRLKYLKPLYTKLASTPEGLERARKIYAVARPGYHPVSAESIDRIVG